MAATELIYFPQHLQLGRGMTFSVKAFRDSAVSPRGSPPHLRCPLQGRPDRTALSSAAGGFCI
jgi:hypothetical protein